MHILLLFKMDNRQGPPVQHRELCSIVCGSLDGRGAWGRIVTVVQLLSPVQLFAIPWTVAHQALLSMGFLRQEYWSGLQFPPPGDLPDLGIELVFLTSPALAGGLFSPLVPPGIGLVRVVLRSICVTLQATVPVWGFPGGARDKEPSPPPPIQETQETWV